jgi:hypothetical protein
MAITQASAITAAVEGAGVDLPREVMKHPTSPDELEPLSEKELGDLLELAHPKLDPFAHEAPEKATLIRRLVAEVRRLQAEVKRLKAKAGP